MVAVGEIASVGQLVRGKGNQLLFENESYVEPSAWYTYDPASGAVKRTAMFTTSPASFSDVEVVRQFAISKDNTRVPMNILRRKGTRLDGNSPTLLYGYGGAGRKQTPPVSAPGRAWRGPRGGWGG